MERISKKIFWRKKVDKSLLKYGVTPIPIPYAKHWDFEEIFKNNTKKNQTSLCKVQFRKKFYTGWITCLDPALKKRKNIEYRFFIDSSLRKILDFTYDLENMKNQFIDIEFQSTIKTIYLFDHYL